MRTLLSLLAGSTMASSFRRVALLTIVLIQGQHGEPAFAQGGAGGINLVEVTAGSGLTLSGHRSGVAVSDFDGDGREDITFTVCSTDQFYRNTDGTTFSDVTATWT